MLEIIIPLQVIVMIGAPIAAAVFVIRRFGRRGVDHLRIFLGGTISFLAAQALLIALAQAAGLLGSTAIPVTWNAIAGAAAFGLALGLCEGLALFAVLRLWLRDVRSWADGLLLGIGYSGSEAIFTGAVSGVWFMTMLSLRGGAPAGQELNEAEKAEFERAVSAYWNIPLESPLAAAAQQVFLLVVSIAVAALVMRVLLSGKLVYLPAAMALSALVRGATLYAANFGPLTSMTVAGVGAVVALLVTRALFLPTPEPVAAQPDAAGATAGADAPARNPRKRRARKA